MSGRKSDYEEKLLTDLLAKYQNLGIVVWGEIEGAPGTYAKVLVKSDGTVKVEGVTTISGTVDVSDRWARQLGQIDIARYLGSAIGLANPLHDQIVYGGVVIDPRDRNWLLGATDIPDLSDRAARLLGIIYGDVGQLLQRPVSRDLLVQLRTATTEYDARQTRALTSSDVVTTAFSATDMKTIRWGIPREPTWTTGTEATAPAAGTALVSKTVTTGKTGRVFGVHISTDEANQFRLYSGATVIKRFALGLAGTIHIVLPAPLLDSVAAATVITIKNVAAGTAGKVYQASLLYDEV